MMRIFNTYEQRMHPKDGRVVSNSVVQALKSENITMYGDGQQTRSFCYAYDLIEDMLRLRESRADFTGLVNIGSPDEFTMLGPAENVLRLLGSKSKLTFHPLPADDPKQRQPDITLVKGELGGTPTVQLEDGLKETVGYFRKLPNV